MKKIMFTLIMVASCFMVFVALLAAYTAESALGTWLVPKGDAKVTIYKCGDKFCGKVSWLKTPEDLDVKNPDPEKRKNKILGMDMLWGFVFKDGQWVKVG